MKTEYELRVLDIDVENVIKKLESLGAEKVDEYDQKRYVYDIIPFNENKWIRLRTNGKKVTLTYKSVDSNDVDGTKEVEVEVSDFETTNELLEKMGYFNKSYQENKRIQYVLNGVEIDIDFWPLIPAYLEVEGNSEADVMNMLNILDVNKEKITGLNCKDIYSDIYNIDIDKIKILKFDN